MMGRLTKFIPINQSFSQFSFFTGPALGPKSKSDQHENEKSRTIQKSNICLSDITRLIYWFLQRQPNFFMFNTPI